MTNQPPKRRTSPFIVWPVCLFILVVLYFASYGPLLLFWKKSWITDDTFDRLYQTVYFPLYWLDGNTNFWDDNPVGRAYFTYLRWWNK